MPVTRRATRLLAYAWASPNTLLGLLLGVPALALGARARLHTGVVEFSGGIAGRLIEGLPEQCRYSAITFGHVVLATSESAQCAVREHERVHVRQYEQWGPLFLPAYLLSSAWQLARGRCPYRDNAFEREAFAVECGPSRRADSINLLQGDRRIS